MVTATMFEAKSDLSRLVDLARKGEEVILTRGREKIPVAKIVAIPPVALQRIGVLEGRGAFDESFFDPLPEEELRLWNGEHP